MPNQGRHDWSELGQSSKEYYRGQGIGPAAYNKWWSMPQLERTAITIEAKKSGYKNGMQFVAVQGQVRTRTNKRISVKTPPKEAARKLIQGTARRDPKRAIVAKLFDFSSFDRLQWTSFMSP
jgi:hypothetical protein